MKVQAEKGHDRYPCLDGMRAFAVTLVFIFHGALGSQWMAEHAGRYIVHFNIGVEIFFVLSGFLIYRPFVRANLSGSPPGSLRNYALRRFLRIFPGYLLALFVLWLLGDIDVNGASGLLKHATLTNTYFRDIGGLGIAQSWTLVVELSFYAFVPLWAFIMRRTSRALPAFGVELVGALALIVVGYASQRVGLLWRTTAGDDSSSSRTRRARCRHAACSAERGQRRRRAAGGAHEPARASPDALVGDGRGVVRVPRLAPVQLLAIDPEPAHVGPRAEGSDRTVPCCARGVRQPTTRWSPPRAQRRADRVPRPRQLRDLPLARSASARTSRHPRR